MDKAVFDALFDLCVPFIPANVRRPREVLAITLDWLGRGATCRDQEAKFDVAFSTAHRYRMIGLHAIVRVLGPTIKLPSTVPTDFTTKHPYFDQAIAAAIDGVHVPVVVASADAERFRNRKEWKSTNVLIASD